MVSGRLLATSLSVWLLIACKSDSFMRPLASDSFVDEGLAVGGEDSNLSFDIGGDGLHVTEFLFEGGADRVPFSHSRQRNRKFANVIQGGRGRFFEVPFEPLLRLRLLLSTLQPLVGQNPNCSKYR